MLYPVLQDPLRPVVGSLFDRPVGVNIRQMLFGAGEQGAWYDPSDMSTLFQDAAGTTPVTAVEQPVGRILDKSGRGNHATQATTTKRPVLSRRVNLLTKTEQFDDVVWTKVNSTISANAIGAPDGLSTADRLVENVGAGGNKQVNTTVSFAAGTVYRMRVWVKPDSRTSVYIGAGSTSPWGSGGQRGVYVNCATGAVFMTENGATAAATIAAGGWVLIDVTFPVTTTGAAGFPLIRLCDEAGSFSYTGDGSGLYIWGASLTLSTDAHLPYQWVNTNTDYDADPTKFPAYLRFDGVDDALQTGNIDFTATDKMTVWAGVTALDLARASGATGQLLYSNGDNFNGFGLRVPSENIGSISFLSSGHVSMAEPSSNFHGTAPTNLIMCGYGDQVAPLSVLRSNGVQRSVVNTAQGTTGGYGNRPMWLASHGGTIRFFNGRLYSLIVRGAKTPLSQIEATELYIKQKMRMP